MKAPDAASLPEGGKGLEAPAGPIAGDSLPATGSGAKPLPKIPQKDARLMAQKMKQLEKWQTRAEGPVQPVQDTARQEGFFLQCLLVGS